MAEVKSEQLGAEIEQVFRDIKILAERVENLQEDRKLNLKDQNGAKPAAEYSLKKKWGLDGHFGKIYAMQWAQHDAAAVVTAAQDGKLMVWDALAGIKTNVMNLRSSWVLTCAWAPDGSFIAAGGLDDICAMYKVQDPSEHKEKKTAYLGHLPNHEGYLSCCRFVDNDHIITASGDASCILWDITTKTRVQTFLGHIEDVMCVSIIDSNTFVSGSVDRTSKLWDRRVNDPNVMTFYSMNSDVNAVEVLPTKSAFVAAAEEGKVALYDLRSYAQLNEYGDAKIVSEATSVAVTRSGGAIVAGYDSSDALVWDTITATQVSELGGANGGHTQRVSSVGVNSDGRAIATASWDFGLNIYA